jgi:hypothetical protein
MSINHENSFQNVYLNRLWGNANNETRSGGGSTIEINKYRVKFISEFIKDNGISCLYDICGDANWQHTIDLGSNCKYFGFDISSEALNDARSKNIDHIHLQFSETPIDLCESLIECSDPENSMIIIKEVIQHLPLDHGLKMLKNIKKSGIKYIAITNHDKDIFNVSENINILTGGFYPNNIYFSPFYFTNPIKDINDILDRNLISGYGNLIIFNIQEQNL